MLKWEVNLTGRPLQPILRGRPAVIREPTGCRRTTPVLWVEQLSSREIIFETQNTVYRLRVVSPEKEAKWA